MTTCAISASSYLPLQDWCYPASQKALLSPLSCMQGLSVLQPFSLTSQIPKTTFPTQRFLAQTYHQVRLQVQQDHTSLVAGTHQRSLDQCMIILARQKIILQSANHFLLLHCLGMMEVQTSCRGTEEGMGWPSCHKQRIAYLQGGRLRLPCRTNLSQILR